MSTAESSSPNGHKAAGRELYAEVGGGVTLCYETFGDPADPPLLLVMGLATQMVGWHEDFCRGIADRGFHVIRFDNRDIGRSTHFHDIPRPRTRQLLTRRFHPEQYALQDMAGDALGLLDEVGHESAHVVGASMGGMIAQTMAATHPDRVRSLVSIMSTTGHRFKGQPAFGLYGMFLRKPPGSREEFVERAVSTFEAIGSPGFERDPEVIRELAELSYDRGHDARGAARQLAAVLKSGNRTSMLREIIVPTTVIHGDSDRLVRPSGGKATAEAIPGAQLKMVEGMGHDLPRQLWPDLIETITAHARSAEGDRAPAPAPA